MKKTIFLFLIFFSIKSFSQEKDSIKFYSKEYNELMNYIPKSLVFDPVPSNRFKELENDFNSIISIGLNTYPITESNLTKAERIWVFKRIQYLASGLFSDGKKVLISTVGGYSGCPDKMIDTVKLKNINITNLMFCHGCLDSHSYDYFIETFNSKMYELMNIKAPDNYTYRFNGEFINKKKKSSLKRLILNQDRSFELFKFDGYTEKVYSGFWENNDLILTLDLSKYKDLEDLKLQYNINRRKIVGINEKNLKFKTIEKN